MRFKTDWSNIDPAGDADGKFDDFKQNGGQIIDVLLEVIAPDGIEAINGENKAASIYDLTGRKLNAEPAKGIYIKNNKKVIR